MSENGDAPQEERYIPTAGDGLNVQDLELIIDSIIARHNNFPEEPMAMTMAIILTSIGDRYSKVVCTEGEWSGIKADFIGGEGAPQCPEGHHIQHADEIGVKLGWVPG